MRIFGTDGSISAPLQVYEGHRSNVTAVAFHREHRWIMSASEDGQIRIWDLRTSQCQREIHNSVAPSHGLFSAGRAPITAAVLHPDQSKVVSADLDGCVRVWDIGTRGCLSELGVCKPPTSASMCL